MKKINGSHVKNMAEVRRILEAREDGRVLTRN